MPSIPIPSPVADAPWATALRTSMRSTPCHCRSTATGSPRRPCFSALVSISWRTRNATASRSGGSGCGVPRTVDSSGWPAARMPSSSPSRFPGGSAPGPASSPVEASTSRTSRSDCRAEAAMFAIVRRTASVSASSRNCADSACTRITASEWPTTSWTSRASCACPSRSAAISCAWARSVSARTRPASARAWSRRALSRTRSSAPISHGTARIASSETTSSGRPVSPVAASDSGIARGRKSARWMPRLRATISAATAPSGTDTPLSHSTTWLP